MLVTMIYESMFGNTETLADAVALGLRDRGAEVAILHAGDPGVHDLHGLDLLVLAAPTHALSLSRPGTRADAVAQGSDPVRAATGLREWLDATPDATVGHEHPPVVVFDTKARIARHWPGSAARKTARALRHKGFEVAQHTTFYVDDVKGPILPGEVQRAREWGRTIAAHGRRPTSPRS